MAVVHGYLRVVINSGDAAVVAMCISPKVKFAGGKYSALDTNDSCCLPKKKWYT